MGLSRPPGEARNAEKSSDPAAMEPSIRIAASAASIIDGDNQGTARPKIELTLADIDFESDNENDAGTPGTHKGKAESPAASDKRGGLAGAEGEGYKWGTVSGTDEGSRIAWESRHKEGTKSAEQVVASSHDENSKPGPSGSFTSIPNSPLDQHQLAGVYRATLRAIFAAQEESEKSIGECYAAAEFLRRAFGFDIGQHQEMVVEAQTALSFCIPEIKAQIVALKSDSGSHAPADFENIEAYKAWKKTELGSCKALLAKLEKLPEFVGTMSVEVLSGSDIKATDFTIGGILKDLCTCRAVKASKCDPYCTVTLVPKSSTSSEVVRSETRVVNDSLSPEWKEKLPQYQIGSPEDEVLVEVWDSDDLDPQHGALSIVGTMNRVATLPATAVNAAGKLAARKVRKSTRPESKHVTNDFIGEGSLTFRDILACGSPKGATLVSVPSKMVALRDWKGRPMKSQVQLRLVCTAAYHHRIFVDGPAVVQLPIADVQKAFDALLAVAWRGGEQDGQKAGTAFSLDQHWSEILHLFESHFRIRSARCSLAMLAQLARRYQPSPPYLRATLAQLANICDLAHKNQLTKHEMDLHGEAIAVLMEPATGTVTSFQTAFPRNQPEGALELVLQLLSLLLKWELDMKRIAIPVRSWVEKCCEDRFKAHLFGAENPTPAQMVIESPATLALACTAVQADLSDLDAHFAPSFPEEVDLLQVATHVYYKALSTAVRKYVEASPEKSFTREHKDLAVSFQDLHAHLDELHIQQPRLDVQSLLHEHIAAWIADTRPRMIDWISSVVCTEKWEPVSVAKSALFSFSIIELYMLIYEVTDEMYNRVLELAFGRDYMASAEAGVCTAVQTYAQVLEKLCLEELPVSLPSEEEKGILTKLMRKKEAPPQLSITKTLCVKLNNLSAVRTQQQQLEHNLEKKWTEAYTLHRQKARIESASRCNSALPLDKRRSSNETQGSKGTNGTNGSAHEARASLNRGDESEMKGVSADEDSDDDDLGFPDEELDTVCRSEPSSGRPSLDESQASIQKHPSNGSRASSTRPSIDEARPEIAPGESGVVLPAAMWAVLNEGKGEDPIGKGFEGLRDYLSQTYEDVVGSIVENIQSRMQSEVQYLFESSSKADKAHEAPSTLEERLAPLTSYLDEHLQVMNGFLSARVFRRVLKEIWMGLLFCMEEFALNKDEDPEPMTMTDYTNMQEALKILYDYFNGGGTGLKRSKMEKAAQRLKRILELWQAPTHDLCAEYWRAWDRFNSANGTALPSKHDRRRRSSDWGEAPEAEEKEPRHVPELSRQSSTASAASWMGPEDDADGPESGGTESELKLPDVICLLRQRKDDEIAEDLLEKQEDLTKDIMVQARFGLPKEDKMVAAFPCRNAKKLPGTLYVTLQHVCWAPTLPNSRKAHEDRLNLALNYEKIVRLDNVGSNHLCFYGANRKPVQFSKFKDRYTVLATIFQQVQGTGLHLESYLAERGVTADQAYVPRAKAPREVVLKRYSCSKFGMVHNRVGTLVATPTLLIFDRPESPEKSLQFVHESIKDIQLKKHGMRESGVAVELKTGDTFEFVQFTNPPKVTADEVSNELRKIVLGGRADGSFHKKTFLTESVNGSSSKRVQR